MHNAPSIGFLRSVSISRVSRRLPRRYGWRWAWPLPLLRCHCRAPVAALEMGSTIDVTTFASLVDIVIGALGVILGMLVGTVVQVLRTRLQELSRLAGGAPVFVADQSTHFHGAGVWGGYSPDG